MIKKTGITIRKATAGDAKALLDIYAPYIEKTAITFEYEVPALEDFENRIRQISKSYPYIVAIEGGKAVGYAYASQYKARAAYLRSVETSIYLDINARHHGIGRRLYSELEKMLQKQGILNMNACITFIDKPDEHLPLDSVHFHETMGFKRCAHFHKIGYKFNKFYDIIWMEKMIGEHV